MFDGVVTKLHLSHKHITGVQLRSHHMQVSNYRNMPEGSAADERVLLNSYS